MGQQKAGISDQHEEFVSSADNNEESAVDV